MSNTKKQTRAEMIVLLALATKLYESALTTGDRVSLEVAEEAIERYRAELGMKNSA